MGTQSSTIIMRLVDGVTGPAKGVAGAMSGLMSGLHGAGSRASFASSILGQTAAALAGVFSVYKMAQFAKQSMQAYADEQAKFLDIKQSTNATVEQSERARTAIHKLASETGISKENMIEGFAEVARGGRSMGDALKLMPQAATAANAYSLRVKDAARATAAMSEQFGIGQKDILGSWDMLNSASNTGRIKAEEWAQMMPKLGLAANIAGMKGQEGLRKLLTIGEAIRPQFNSSEEALTELETVMKKMNNATVLKAFEKNGVPLAKLLDNAKKSGKDAFETFYHAALRVTKGDLTKLPEILGKSGQSLVEVMRAIQLAGDTRPLFANIAPNTGATLEQAKERAESTKAQIENLTTAWEGFKTSFAGALTAGGAESAISKLISMIDYLSAKMNALADIKKDPAAYQRSAALEKAKIDLHNAELIRKQDEEAKKSATDTWLTRWYYDRNVEGSRRVEARARQAYTDAAMAYYGMGRNQAEPLGYKAPSELPEGWKTPEGPPSPLRRGAAIPGLTPAQKMEIDISPINTAPIEQVKGAAATAGTQAGAAFANNFIAEIGGLRGKVQGMLGGLSVPVHVNVNGINSDALPSTQGGKGQ